jgi:serine/threonine protein kinase/ligand-binding sensor domain-containing protein
MQRHIGGWLGPYQITEQIGQGGMATVFKAYQPSMDRYVAIKILPSRFAEDESFVGRFTQEARTLARLEHPHILPVHDYGEHEGTTYLVMRYVEAGTLKDLIAREGPMELREAARVLGQLGRALDYAHSQGVLHRDIKPSNVLIDQRNNTFLTDFGIAKLIAETAQFTASGAIIGTPAYMSPEQGMGKPVDHHCDIYSLGVVLYELVTGRVPFEAETPLAVVLKHVNDPLPLPRQIKPDLPAAVERVILKAMAKVPADRFQSAKEMIDALEAAVATMPEEIASQRLRAGAAEATTLASGITLPPSPAADTAPPSPALDTAPTRLEAMIPASWRKRWLLFVGGAALLGLLLVVGLRIVSNLNDREPTPITVGQAQPTITAVGQAQPTPTTVGQVPATPTPESQPVTVPPSAVSEQARPPSGWTNYGNSNFVFALARQGDTLWAGGECGLVGWDLTDGSHTRIGRADGLASSRINDLLVDEEGDLWIATDAGINRDNGEAILTYDEADGLDASWIQALFLDGEGGLWAGSHGGERGLNYYDGKGWGPPPIPSLPLEDPSVRVLVGNEQEGLFVGLEGQGLAHYDWEAWSILTSADGLPSDAVLDALLTHDALWVSFDVAVVRFDLETGDREIISQADIHAMAQTAGGELWFGGEWRAVRFDPDTGDWEEFETAPGPIPGWMVTDILEDVDGLWFGTYGGGVAFYQGGRWETWAVDEKLGGNRIEAIRQDKDGAVWFTHPGTGLSRYEPEGDVWKVFGEAAGAPDWPSVPGVDSNGNLWIGETGEIARYDGQGWQRFRTPELADVTINAIEIGPGDVQWLATDSGLMRHDPATDEWTTFTGADHPIIEAIWSFLVSRDGTVWVGGEEGLVQYDGSTWSTPVASGSAPRLVDDLAEAPDGSLWIAADGELVHLAGGRWSYYAWPSDGWMERVAIGPDGSVWAGYEGLGHFDPVDGGWQIFTPDDGLVHMTVQAIHVTPEGVVWIGTESGVSRYVPPD